MVPNPTRRRVVGGSIGLVPFAGCSITIDTVDGSTADDGDDDSSSSEIDDETVEESSDDSSGGHGSVRPDGTVE